MNNTVSRRQFLGTTLRLGLGGAIVVSNQGLGEPRRLKAAVIGHTGRGDYGHGLEAIFQGLPGVELVAVSDPDAKGRAAVAARIGAPHAYEDYREMLERHKPDLVSLAMRHADQHHAIALAAIRSGAHVYCEKPFTTTLLEGDEVLQSAALRKRKIAVAHTMRMTGGVQALKAAVGRGLLGDVVELRAYGKQDARAGGEDMMVLGTHLFDLMRLFVGDPLSCSAEVLNQGRRITTHDARVVKDSVGRVAGDQISARFLFQNGVNASFTSAGKLRDTVGRWGLEIHGSRGAARINCDLEPSVFIRKPAAWSNLGRSDIWAPFEFPDSNSPASLKHNEKPVNDWLTAIERDHQPECSGLNGLWAVEMVMAVYQSALTGARVDFPLKDRRHPLA